MNTFTILGEDTKIEITILKRNFPELEDFWDSNWLSAALEIKIPGFHVTFPFELRTDEIESFLDDLLKMNKTLKGKAILSSLEGFIHFEGRVNRTGTISWEAEVKYPLKDGVELTFTYSSDQSFLPKLILELQQVMMKYPVVGKQ
jgi:hypothetical protein